MQFRISHAFFTDSGDRPVNEDAIGAFTKDGQYCFVLCDGLGGHGMGDVASNLCKSVFEKQFYAVDDMDNYIADSLLLAQDALLLEQKRCRATSKMKTTAVAVVIDKTHANIGHVGDSRLYLFHKSKIKKRTLDHSVPQMLVMSREIKESEIRNHPDRSILLRVLGEPWDEPRYELMEPVRLKDCLAFLLCSDGFWELIDEKEMCNQLKKASTVSEWLSSMTDIVKQNGIGSNMDNYSAIAIWVTQEKRNR